MVRLELVDSAVNEIMASTFDVPVMKHVIVYGNEAEIEAELERINFELRQLAAQGLPWEEEDRERARLRAEHERVANTELIDDRVELVRTDHTYLGLWERLSTPDRGPWLAEHGFRVTASKERVIVSRGEIEGKAELTELERRAPAQDTEPVYWGKCECGCGTEIYGSKYRQKRYANENHRRKAIRRLAPAPSTEPVYWGKCECGCGTEIYGSKYRQKRHVNENHRRKAIRQHPRRTTRCCRHDKTGKA